MPPDLGFAAMQRDSRVLQAFWAVHRSCNEKLDELYELYQGLWPAFNLQDDESSKSLMLSACLQHRKHPRALVAASAVFADYAKSLGPDAWP